MAKKAILTILGGGPGFTLEDTDLWGLESAIIHGQMNGYFNDNKEWAEAMLEKIGKLRDQTNSLLTKTD